MKRYPKNRNPSNQENQYKSDNKHKLTHKRTIKKYKTKNMAEKVILLNLMYNKHVARKICHYLFPQIDFQALTSLHITSIRI